ncbi:MAG: efflux RND transporter periplasmic adaptor subunit [Steroidobacteraceae bacterium]
MGSNTAAALAIIVLGSLIAAGCSDSSAVPAATSAADKSAEAADAIPVEVSQPFVGDFIAHHAGTGTLIAEADAIVPARVGGEVRRLLVEEGDKVRKGQLLATIDERQLTLELQQIDAQLAKARADYRRQLELHDKGLIAAGAFENQRFDLSDLKARHDLATLNLSFTNIRAPFDGIVAERHVRVGENLAAGAPAFRITNPNPLRTEVYIPERELARLAVGQRALIEVDALASQQFAGAVTLVAPTVDPKTATFKVTIEVDSHDGALKPGMFARVAIELARRAGSLQIPRNALLENTDTPQVFVVDDGHARLRTIKTGMNDSRFVEVLDGLDRDSKVVVVGQTALKDGSAIRVVSLDDPAKG